LLEVADLLAERFAFPGVLGGSFQHVLREPNGLCAEL